MRGEERRGADTALYSVLFLLLFVARSKLVPDFAFTIHLLHLLVTFFYSRSIPTNTLWWALQVASAALMISLGMWICQLRELKPINFGGSNSTNQISGRTATDFHTSGSLEEGDGHVRAFEHGRSPDDGGGQYELVSMKAKEGVP